MRIHTLLTTVLAFALASLAAPVPAPEAAAAEAAPRGLFSMFSGPRDLAIDHELMRVGETVKISWSGGTAPYEVRLDSYQPSVKIGQRIVDAWREPSMMVHATYWTNDTEIGWVADVRRGTSVIVSVIDAEDNGISLPPLTDDKQEWFTVQA